MMSVGPVGGGALVAALGAGLTATGVGAAVGVPLMALGALTTGAGVLTAPMRAVARAAGMATAPVRNVARRGR